MNYFWKTFSLAMLLALIGQVTQAQPVYIDHRDQEKGMTVVCVAPSATLRELPGEKNIALGQTFFGEEVTHEGQEALVKGENHNYILVRTQTGKIGWVDDRFLVKDAGVVVLTDDARLYESPGNYTTALGQFFYAGEIAILSSYENNWIKLIGRNKNKIGWIKGYEILSVEPTDLEIAKLLSDALDIADPTQRRLALENIGDTPGFNGSPLAGVVKEEVLLTAMPSHDQLSPGKKYLQEGVDDFFPNGEDDIADDIFGGIDDLGTIPEDGNNNRPGYEVQDVIDRETGKMIQRVRETGTIQPVKAKNPKTELYAYHKTAPVGSKILLEVPGTTDYVPLTVVAKLRNDNPHIVGLGSEVIQKVFGESQAKNVTSATILYFP